MAASGRMTIAQDGGQGNVKLHPYLAALVRWCISSIWTTATVLLHRLMTAPLPPSTGSKPSKPRPASSDHLHPEPLVECVVLHQPTTHTLDVVFVHGLYGSLTNTWRQGEWRCNYKTDPIKVPLRRHNTIPTACGCKWDKVENTIDECACRFINESKASNSLDFNANGRVEDLTREDKKFYERYRKVLPEDDIFITEKFYNNTLLDRAPVGGDYETQASFVRDLFARSSNGGNERDASEAAGGGRGEGAGCGCGRDAKCASDVRCPSDVKCASDTKCASNVKCASDAKCASDVKCAIGCGCTCDVCYTPCWPRDWIKLDFPGARVVSVNYTSDPYLWRPLWIKESKRQRLHERADQMMLQLLELGVGEKPVVWVGHSKGGLFIKQMYCDAHEAYLKLNENKPDVVSDDNPTESSDKTYEDMCNGNSTDMASGECVTSAIKLTDLINYIFGGENDCKSNEVAKDVNRNNLNAPTDDETKEHNDDTNTDRRESEETYKGDEEIASNGEEDPEEMMRRANLWKNSAGFMFYSVPHRGSPLADIKTPITARSIELLEICKDCSLVMTLQDRWLKATSMSAPAVSSLVETCKTLMSLLWLRIVSEDSADPGIGALSGVSVDHREICKPSSRKCLLYRELKPSYTTL